MVTYVNIRVWRVVGMIHVTKQQESVLPNHVTQDTMAAHVP